MRRAALLIAAGLFVAACSGTPRTSEIQVRMTDFAFERSEIAVTAGQPVRVTLVNNGSLEHDFSIMEFPMEMTSAETGGRKMGSGMEPEMHMSAMAGETMTTEFTPTAPGSYEFFCTVAGHKEAGMVGMLTVLAP